MDAESANAGVYVPKTFEEKMALYGVFLGDAFGAGWEMKSREQILKMWDELDVGYHPRDAELNENHVPGRYTDDGEMTLGTMLAIKTCNEQRIQLTPDLLVASWADVFLANFAVQGERAGYGSFSRIALINADPTKTKEEYDAMVIKNRMSQAGKDPGNANVMRQIPFLYMTKKDDDLIIGSVINSLATHGHPHAVMAGILLILAADFLAIGVSPSNIIKYCLLNAKSMLAAEPIRKLLGNDHYYMKDRAAEAQLFNEMNERLVLIDQEPLLAKDDLQLTTTNISLLANLDYPNGSKYAKPLKGGVGLSAKAENTAYCALYLLKNLQSTDAYGNLKRCMAIGGDTDTLASIVMSCVLPFKIRTEQEFEAFKKSMPDWVCRDLELPAQIQF